jgi:hypothetical protein
MFKKKSIFIFCSLMSGASLFGAPVGNPSFPRLLKEGFLIPESNHFNIRLGYEGDFMTNGYMKQTVEGYGRVDNYCQDVNSGTLTLNFFDRLDLYGVFGAARTCADWRYIYEEAIWRVQLETSYQFLWAAGGRVVLFEWGKTIFGVSGRYSSTQTHPTWTVLNDIPIPSGGTCLQWSAWQIDGNIAYPIDIFVPYLGIKYLSAQAKVGPFSDVPIASSGSGTLHMRNRNPVGIVIGCTLTTERYFMLNIEGRLIDEFACSIVGDFRF